MCFSLEMSIAALVVGLCINGAVAAILISRNYPQLHYRLAVLVAWTFALLMQIPEGLQWYYLARAGKHLQPTKQYMTAAYLAFFLNILQPFVLWMCLAFVAFWYNENISGARIVGAGAIAMVFVFLAMVRGRHALERRDIRPAPDCDHLHLHWWNGTLLTPLLPLYLLGTIAALYFLLPVNLAAVQITYFLGTLLMSHSLYRCGTASVWCWFVALAGLTLLLP
jgi:hypothetical protein